MGYGRAICHQAKAIVWGCLHGIWTHPSCAAPLMAEAQVLKLWEVQWPGQDSPVAFMRCVRNVSFLAHWVRGCVCVWVNKGWCLAKGLQKLINAMQVLPFDITRYCCLPLFTCSYISIVWKMLVWENAFSNYHQHIQPISQSANHLAETWCLSV